MTFKRQEKSEENIIKTQSVTEENYPCSMYKIKSNITNLNIISNDKDSQNDIELYNMGT